MAATAKGKGKALPAKRARTDTVSEGEEFDWNLVQRLADERLGNITPEDSPFRSVSSYLLIISPTLSNLFNSPHHARTVFNLSGNTSATGTWTMQILRPLGNVFVVK